MFAKKMTKESRNFLRSVPIVKADLGNDLLRVSIQGKLISVNWISSQLTHIGRHSLYTITYVTKKLRYILFLTNRAKMRLYIWYVYPTLNTVVYVAVITIRPGV